jgi:hypothetical protein
MGPSEVFSSIPRVLQMRKLGFAELGNLSEVPEPVSGGVRL